MTCKLPDIVIKSLSFQCFFYYQIGFKTYKLILDNSNHTCAKLINILLVFFYMYLNNYINIIEGSHETSNVQYEEYFVLL